MTQTLDNLIANKTKKKIIIADDEEIYRISVGVALKKDYDIEYASNANELIEKTLNQKYSLILTDNQMGDGHEDSGLYAVQKIREKNKDVPIIMNTSELSDRVREKADRIGINEVLKKPLNIMEFREILKKYVSS